jgi:small conductance mechanosensitive channel
VISNQVLNDSLYTAARIFIIVLLALILLRLFRVAQRRMETTILEKQKDTDWAGRVRTVIQVSRNILNVVVVFLALLMILVALGINIAPMLAGAGIAGLAVSLGAQTVIKDVINGILILFENQFKVGDHIKVYRTESVEGDVERITLRTISLRGQDGSLHIVPNGEIRVISNRSLDWQLVEIRLAIPAEIDMKTLLECLQQAGEMTRKDPAIENLLITEPEVRGWVGWQENEIQANLSAKCKPGKQEIVVELLRKNTLFVLENAGIHQIKFR